ncbi:hypothetical protein NPIL_441401 [Nephila pilipes]|uniref:RNase H type-1 domain-containing protein n=1 Tax=Nephila pilipes TaxID=299642 RepID=A0A8X6UM75_NEPPI|nr:hypothetical protein NPIL_441401 [Nephila pilipes]
MGLFWTFLKVLAQVFLVTPFHSTFMLEHGIFTTHFSGEREAIHVALQQLRLDTFERAVISSDSVSALQSLSSKQESLCVQRCRVFLKEFKGKLSFQWILSHCGLKDNETADFLAKKRELLFSKSLVDIYPHIRTNWRSREFLSNHFIIRFLLLLMISPGVYSVDPTVS